MGIRGQSGSLLAAALLWAGAGFFAAPHAADAEADAEADASAEHTYEWVAPALELDVEPGRRTARIQAALERIPDCVHERMRLVGARMTVIGTRAPHEHPLEVQANHDFLFRGWGVLALPFVRVQGQAYQLHQEAFVRRGGRGPVSRSRLFTHWIPLTGRGEETALHEYAHLLSGALGLRSSSEFFALWARHAPNAVTDTLSIRRESTKQEEWFARMFERFHRSDAARDRLPDEARRYLEVLEADIHRGRYDPRFLELARLSSRNPQLAAARELGQRLLPAQLAGELREAGAWGLGYFGQLWYAIQSEAMREANGAAFDLLAEQRQRLVGSGAVTGADEVHLRETCGDVSQSPICESVRRHRSRIEARHPCLGPPVRGCVISYGPGEALLTGRSDAATFPWLSAERHREIALGRERQRAASRETANEPR